MSSTTTNGHGAAAGRVPGDVADFAAAVRRSLEDLPPDEVEELVDGLEADLIEGREDSGEPLGDPVAYADELRSAAGLPPRDERSGGEWFGGYKRLWASTSSWIREKRENPTVAAVLDFVVALRSVWWVLRGWVAFAITAMFGALTPMPDTVPGWLLLVGYVTVSVQWGRGRWLPWTALRVAKIVVSVVTLFALPVVLGQMAWALEVAAYGNSSTMEGVDVAPTSTFIDTGGDPVTNLFAFDCAGNPLSGVQLFDQNGEPLDLDSYGPDEEWVFGVDELGREIAIVPNPNTTGGTGWNVFPLLEAEFGATYEPDASTAKEPNPPFDAVQPLADAEETCETVPADGTDGATTETAPTETAPTDGGR